MKTIDIDAASLQVYARKRRRETLVLTRRGKPIAALVPLHDEMDAETFAAAHSPAFIEIVNRSWSDYEKNGGLSSEEARRCLGMVKATRKTGRRGR